MPRVTVLSGPTWGGKHHDVSSRVDTLALAPDRVGERDWRVANLGRRASVSRKCRRDGRQLPHRNRGASVLAAVTLFLPTDDKHERSVTPVARHRA
jgi:hypothetical protein